MSVLSTATLARQPSYDVLCRGDRKGFTQNLVKVRPDYSSIDTLQKRKEAVKALVDHIIVILQEFNDENLHEQYIKEVVIGKTYIQGKSRIAFDQTDGSTWKIGGVSSRWSTKYQSDSNALVVIECFCLSDVPLALREVFDMDQQNFGLMFENLVLMELKSRIKNKKHDLYEQIFKFLKVKNSDDGGGGRFGQTTIGTVLYVTIKLAEMEVEEEEVEEEEKEEEEEEE